VLLEVRIAAARTLADLAIAVARLEGAVALPLTAVESEIPDTDESAAGGVPAAIDHSSGN
jgi:hypothetical protein